MGAEYALPAAFKKTALRQFMIGEARNYYDNLDAAKEDIDELIAKCYEYANRKRISPGAMDVGNVACNEELPLNYGGEPQWEHSWGQENELDAVGKG